MSEQSTAGAPSLLGIGTWVRQGPAILVVRGDAWVVLVPGTRKQVVEAAWQVLEKEPAPEDLLDDLVEAAELESADKIKALLFGFHDGTTATFGVKGTTPIAVYTAEGSQQIAGTEEEPFVLKTFEGVRRTAFGDLPAEESVGLPRVMAGVVPVRGFVRCTVDPAQLDEDERAALAEQVEQDGRSIEDPEAKKRRAAAPKPPPPPAPTAPDPPRVKLPTADRAPGAMPPSLSRGGSGQAQSGTAGPETSPSAPNMFDGLFAERASASAPSASAPSVSAPAAGAESAAAPGPAAAPAPAAMPAPAATPAPATESSATPAAADTDPSETATPPSAAASSTPAEAQAPAAKRRLVSTSLFDRGRRPAAAAKDADPVAQPRPASGAPEAPGPSSDPVPAQPSPAAPPTSTRPAAAPAPAPAPTPTAAIPTPAPPEDDDFISPATQIAPIDDDFESPPTLIAPLDDGEGEEEPAEPARRRRPVPPQTGADLENTGAYDDLFGKTVFRRIEDAAVRRSAEEGDEEQGPQPSTPASDPAPAQASPPAEDPEPRPEPEVAPAPAAPAGGGEFIDWVPGVGRTAPEIAQTAARRATAIPRPETAYPQVHMAERRPVQSPGSRPAPTAPPAPPAPQHGGSTTAGDAGRQLGYRMPPAEPQHRPHGSAGAIGRQLGEGAPAAPGSANLGPAAPGHAHHAAPPTPAPWGQGTPARSPAPQRPQSAPPPSSWGGTPGQAPAVPPAGAQGGGRHAGAPHPVAPSAPPAAAQQVHPPRPTSGAAPSGGGPGQVVGGGVTLTGLVCPEGHANSPEHSLCRACGAPLPNDPRIVVRPPLGAVAITGGERFVLDRTAIVGRRPRASRVSGNEVPQLITVPSPQQDISRSHLELRLEGWHVVALDLGTTNGTTLYREGYDPVRLRPREGVVLRNGDRLDLGDDVQLMFGERV